MTEVGDQSAGKDQVAKPGSNRTAHFRDRRHRSFANGVCIARKIFSHAALHSQSKIADLKTIPLTRLCSRQFVNQMIICQLS